MFIYLYLFLIKNKVAFGWEPAVKFVSLGMLDNKDRIGLDELVVGTSYIGNGETVFTYVGAGDNELFEHNVVLECGTESFLVDGDYVASID